MELSAGVVPVGRSENGEWFEQVYREHADRVYGWLLVRGLNHADAQDVTSQVFLEAWR